MHSTEILATEPGIELDGHVAEEVMDIKTLVRAGLIVDETETPIPAYSEDISCAFQVVDKMLLDGLSLELIICPDNYVMARFFDAGILDPSKATKGEMVSETIPEAIVKAALLCK